MHWNHTAVIDGIPYITVESLVCCGMTNGQPAGAFTEVIVEETGRVQVEVRGALPMTFTHP
jgi:hypothetical protein